MSPEPATVEQQPDIPWKKVTGLKHKIDHDYFVLDLGIVWDTATIDVPAIRPLVESLLWEVDGRR